MGRQSRGWLWKAGRGLAGLWALVLVVAPMAVSAEGSSELPVVALVPLGHVPARLLEEVARGIEQEVHLRTRIDPERALPPEAFYSPRRRWRAEKILESLDQSPPPGAFKVVAVTQAEISTTKEDLPDWGIGGLGDIGGRSCVVSTFLIQKSSRGPERLHRRLRNLAVHELGHTLGRPHCPVFACVMQDAKGKLIRSLDGSTGHFCGQCQRALGAP